MTDASHNHVIIAVEGREDEVLLPGRILEPGSVTWDEDIPMPIVENFNFEDPKAIKGRAINLQREGDNITADIPKELFETIDVIKDGEKQQAPLWMFAIFASDVRGSDQMEDGKIHITHCRLRALGRIPSPEFGAGRNPGTSLV